MLFFRADNGKALTIFFAGFAFTIIILPNISFLPALVAGFIRVFSLNKPGIEKVPVLPATSFVAMVVKLPMSFVHTFLFSSHLSASAATIAVLVMAFAVAGFIVLIGGSIARVGRRLQDVRWAKFEP